MLVIYVSTTTKINLRGNFFIEYDIPYNPAEHFEGLQLLDTFKLCDPLFYNDCIVFPFEHSLSLCLDYLQSSQYLDHELGQYLSLHLLLFSSLSNYSYRVPTFISYDLKSSKRLDHVSIWSTQEQSWSFVWVDSLHNLCIERAKKGDGFFSFFYSEKILVT